MKTYSILALSIAMLGSSFAMAEDFNYEKANSNYVDSSGGEGGNPFYFGGSIGSTTSSDYCANQGSSCEDSDTSWKMYGGYKLNDMFAVEGAYMNIGDLRKSTGSSDVSALTVTGVGEVPVTETINAMAKAGLARTASDNTADGGSNKAGYGVTYGVGAKMQMNETTKLRAEWESLSNIKTSNSEEHDASMLSVGVEFTTY